MEPADYEQDILCDLPTTELINDWIPSSPLPISSSSPCTSFSNAANRVELYPTKELSYSTDCLTPVTPVTTVHNRNVDKHSTATALLENHNEKYDEFDEIEVEEEVGVETEVEVEVEVEDSNASCSTSTMLAVMGMGGMTMAGSGMGLSGMGSGKSMGGIGSRISSGQKRISHGHSSSSNSNIPRVATPIPCSDARESYLRSLRGLIDENEEIDEHDQNEHQQEDHQQQKLEPPLETGIVEEKEIQYNKTTSTTRTKGGGDIESGEKDSLTMDSKEENGMKSKPKSRSRSSSRSRSRLAKSGRLLYNNVRQRMQSSSSLSRSRRSFFFGIFGSKDDHNKCRNIPSTIPSPIHSQSHDTMIRKKKTNYGSSNEVTECAESMFSDIDEAGDIDYVEYKRECDLDLEGEGCSDIGEKGQGRLRGYQEGREKVEREDMKRSSRLRRTTSRIASKLARSTRAIWCMV